jgi:antitoxin component YwqK of YwqJK toxin-antitoxin module
MKLCLTICLVIFCLQATAQTPIIKKYYDADWAVTSADRAIYYTEFVKEGDAYRSTSYWTRGNAVRGRALFPDTIMAMPVGWEVHYYKKGNIEDSVYYEDKGVVTDAYFYHPNKQLGMHYSVGANQKEGVTEGYDETGKKIKNYVYSKEAEFKGGDKAWNSFLLKNTSKDFFNTKTEEEITVKVQIQFIVDESGFVTRPKVKESSGMKNIDSDALRVISTSPQWKNALLYNNPVKAYRIQPFIYKLSPPKKK